MADKQSSTNYEASDAQIVRGGGPSLGAAGLQLAESAQRWFVRGADAIHNRMHAFGGLDPARPVKNVTGWAVVAISADQAAQDLHKGNYDAAAFHGFVAANVAATSIAPINDAVSTALTKAPVTRHISEGVAKVLSSGALNPEIRAACGALKPVPLAGAAINGVMGIWAAGARATHGDYKGAGGELAVTAASVGVYAMVVVAGAALLTVGAPTIAIGAAAVGAYVASEAATEITSRVYNHYAGSNVRGSGLVAVGSYIANRVSSLLSPEPEKPAWHTQQYHLNGVSQSLDGFGVRDHLTKAGIKVDADGKNGISREEFAKAVAAWNNTNHQVNAQHTDHAPSQASQTPNHKPVRAQATQLA